MDKGVKESPIHINSLILILDEVDLLLHKFITLTCFGGC
jgi:hypothetical protein